jgi:hypothetical protein
MEPQKQFQIMATTEFIGKLILFPGGVLPIPMEGTSAGSKAPSVGC